jgi:hypothetical protein
VKSIVSTKEEYIRLIPPLTSSEYERLKRSIKEEGGLLVPVVLNQNNVVLDGLSQVESVHRARSSSPSPREGFYRKTT